MPVRPISGPAWYNILSNPAYARDFNYIAVDTPHRSTLIIDEDSDDENNCEQSDMVDILINLADCQ